MLLYTKVRVWGIFQEKKITDLFEHTENITEWCVTIMSQHLENNTDKCVENKAK